MPFLWQDQIIREVGDPNDTLAAVIDDLWTAFSAVALIDTNLQILYAKRACIDVRLAEEQASFDVGLDGDNYRRSQRFDHLSQMREATQTEIVRIEKQSTKRGRPAAGQLTSTEPYSPVADGPDANDAIYAGLPRGMTPLE